MTYKKEKNLLSSADEYNRYYGDFRGVDFSSDHTQVHDQRFAYAVNMYKDYGSGQGQAIETIPGFRRIAEVKDKSKIYGIHRCEFIKDGERVKKTLLHAGSSLYEWHGYPNTSSAPLEKTLPFPNTLYMTETEEGTVWIYFTEISLDSDIAFIESVTATGSITDYIDFYDVVVANGSMNVQIHTKPLQESDYIYAMGESLKLLYYSKYLPDEAVFSGIEMNEKNSISFIFNNRLYIIDGKNYLVYDGETVRNVLDIAYIPTTYIGIIPDGENADTGTQFENRNMLSPYFKNTFVARAGSSEYYLSENNLEEISEVKVYGEVWTEAEKGFTVDLTNGCIVFGEVRPGPPEENGYPEGYAGIEVSAKKTYSAPNGGSMADMINHCTVAEIYDGRVFLSGNGEYPNHVFYCDRNTTGYADPTYFGIISYVQDGVGNAPVTGLMRVADTLMVLKSDTQQDGSVYFHTAQATGENLATKVYPSTQGLAGIGCVGACRSFFDDPIFISRLGVEAIGQLSVRYERAVEHRSSLIDAKLTGLNLSNAMLEEWNGYLLLFVDGKIFMADSRQRYTNSVGVTEYEWYYLEDIGVYEGGYQRITYSKSDYEALGLDEVQISDGRGGYKTLPLVEPSDDMDGTDVLRFLEDGRLDVLNTPSMQPYYSNSLRKNLAFAVLEDKAYACSVSDEYIGGDFKAASVIKNLDDNIVFGTENGVVCLFNFDKRDQYGEIPSYWYSFDNRTIFSGCATKMDCCGIPHLTKTTIKKSIVIKSRAMTRSAFKVKVRTNRKPYNQIARINSSAFNFNDIDFSDFSFDLEEQSLFALKEKEKKWVEKQYLIYSDEFRKPCSLYYISYRYRVAGRYKGK